MGTTTRPVTQTEVVAVNNASINGVALPLAELTGKHSRTVPIKIAARKLSIIMWVVDILKCCFFINTDTLNLFVNLHYIIFTKILQCFIIPWLHHKILHIDKIRALSYNGITLIKEDIV